MFSDLADGVVEEAAMTFVREFNSHSDHLEACALCHRQTGEAASHRAGCIFKEFEQRVRMYNRRDGTYWRSNHAITPTFLTSPHAAS